MSEEHTDAAAARLRGENRTFEIIRPTTGDHGQLTQLGLARRTAQAAANAAYEEWSRRLTSDTYAVFRAAQDRADAAQDRLAAFARSTKTTPVSSI